MGPQDASDRIWLKQSVQFSVAGQVRTIEIALPVRPGASAEEIERLLRQADAGLDQMSQHLNNKMNELLDQGHTQAQPGTASAARRSPRAQAAEEFAAPAEPGRAGVGLAGSAGAGSADAGPPLDRKQFIAESAVLGLNPRQAMERLGLRTLDGVNLRQALEQLRLQLLQERPASSGPPAARAEDFGGSPSGGPPTRGSSAPHAGGPARRQPPELKQTSPRSQAAAVEHAVLRPLPERELLEDEEPFPLDVAAPEHREPLRERDQAQEPIPIRGELRGELRLASLQEQGQARARLERLSHIRGRLNPPGSDHLKAFRNVVESQIGEEKTTALLQRVWHVTLPDQLSIEQVAECILWGKNDYFEDEVDMLLSLSATEEL